jgi:hypothetical protein
MSYSQFQVQWKPIKWLNGCIRADKQDGDCISALSLPRLRKNYYSNITGFKQDETKEMRRLKRYLHSVTIPALPSMHIIVCTHTHTHTHVRVSIHNNIHNCTPISFSESESSSRPSHDSLHKHAASFVYTTRPSTNSNYQFKVFPRHCNVQRCHLRFK